MGRPRGLGQSAAAHRWWIRRGAVGWVFNLDGEWDVENVGVAPDIEVDEDPKFAAEGRDAQLERAVQVALDLLETQSVELLPQPPDPIRVRRAGQ